VVCLQCLDMCSDLRCRLPALPNMAGINSTFQAWGKLPSRLRHRKIWYSLPLKHRFAFTVVSRHSKSSALHIVL
jgi:hypothetical protein